MSLAKDQCLKNVLLILIKNWQKSLDTCGVYQWTYIKG